MIRIVIDSFNGVRMETAAVGAERHVKGRSVGVMVMVMVVVTAFRFVCVTVDGHWGLRAASYGPYYSIPGQSQQWCRVCIQNRVL